MRLSRSDGPGSVRAIDVNNADELDGVAALSGLWFEIVRYREERGGFNTLRQLDECQGLSGRLNECGSPGADSLTRNRG